jgi:hypothetical protein
VFSMSPECSERFCTRAWITYEVIGVGVWGVVACKGLLVPASHLVRCYSLKCAQRHVPPRG